MIRRAFARVRGSPLDVDVLLLTVLCLPALAPLFAPGYVATHDGLFHLFRLVELDSLWKGGELYPRLAPDLALGYDYPVFNYYAPLALYAGELLRLLGLSATDAVSANLRPILSPIWPKTKLPKGRMKKPAAKTPNAARSEETASCVGKNWRPIVAAK